MDNLTYPAATPPSYVLPTSPVEVEVVFNQESHITNRQAAADVIHYCFPNAPVPIRIEPGHTDDSTGVCTWLVDLDALNTQRAGVGVHTKIEVGRYWVEVVQP